MSFPQFLGKPLENPAGKGMMGDGDRPCKKVLWSPPVDEFHSMGFTSDSNVLKISKASYKTRAFCANTTGTPLLPLCFLLHPMYSQRITQISMVDTAPLPALLGCSPLPELPLPSFPSPSLPGTMATP